MIWSRFVHAFPEIGILWHSVRLVKYQAGQKVLKHFSPGGPISPEECGIDNYSTLVSLQFIVQESDETENCLRNIQDATCKQRTVQAMYLLLTTSCNLRCSYCLYNASRSGSLSGHGRNMSPKVANEAIELFSRETQKNDRSNPDYWEDVTFYGGEPLLNTPVLESSVRKIRKLQSEGVIWRNTHLILNTNGTLMTDHILRFVKDESIEVQVSIDGPQQIHDNIRMFRSGKGSFGAILSGMEKMKKWGIDFVPLITITNFNMTSLPKFVDWLCRVFEIKSYGLNLLMHTRGKYDLDYGARAARVMKKVHVIAESYGVEDKMYSGSFNVFSSGKIVPQSCGAGRKLVIFPHGEIHTCQALERSELTVIGKLPKFEPDSPNRIYWNHRNKFRNTMCLRCPAIGGCGGGCGANAFNIMGDAHGIDPTHCGWMMEIFSQWLKDSTNSQKGQKLK